MLAFAQEKIQEQTIVEVNKEYDSLTTEIRNIEEGETVEKDTLNSVVRTMEDRNKKRKDTTIAAADLPTWSEPSAKRQRTIKRTDTLSQENKTLLLEEAQKMIMERLKSKGKDVKFAPIAFDKDNDGFISTEEFVLVMGRNFKFSKENSIAAYSEIPKKVEDKLTHSELKDWLSPPYDFDTQPTQTVDDF